METNTAAPEVAQAKTLAQKHAEAVLEEQRLWDSMKMTDAIAEPYVLEQDRARAAWCKAHDRRVALALMVKEMAAEPKEMQ